MDLKLVEVTSHRGRPVTYPAVATWASEQAFRRRIEAMLVDVAAAPDVLPQREARVRQSAGTYFAALKASGPQLTWEVQADRSRFREDSRLIAAPGARGAAAQLCLAGLLTSRHTSEAEFLTSLARFADYLGERYSPEGFASLFGLRRRPVVFGESGHTVNLGADYEAQPPGSRLLARHEHAIRAFAWAEPELSPEDVARSLRARKLPVTADVIKATAGRRPGDRAHHTA
jgi:hypothetical protein